MTQNDAARRGKTQRDTETRADIIQDDAERLIQRRFPFLVGHVTQNTTFFDTFFDTFFVSIFSGFWNPKTYQNGGKNRTKNIENSMKNTSRF